MNQTFDTRRFAISLRHFLAMRGRNMLSVTGITLGILTASDFFHGLASYSASHYDDIDPLAAMIQGYFWVAMVAICCICAGQMFKPLAKKSPATAMLMLPASQLEKYLCQLITCVMLPPVVFMIGFELLELVRCLIVNLVYPATTPAHIVTLGQAFEEMSTDTVYDIIFILFVQSCFALGSSVWPRHGIAYTLCAGLILGFAFCWWGIFLLYREGFHYISLDGSWLTPGGFVALLLGWTILDYVVAYYRYKEAEIINRL